MDSEAGEAVVTEEEEEEALEGGEGIVVPGGLNVGHRPQIMCSFILLTSPLCDPTSLESRLRLNPGTVVLSG